MTTNTATPVVEVVPAGQVLSDGRGKATHTKTYDVVCSRCGPIASGKMYPTACAEKNEHLCRPKARRG